MLVEDNEEEGESNLYTNLEYVQDTENELMDESTLQETFWYNYQRDNKPVEQVTMEHAITLMEGEVTMLRRNLGEMNDSTMIQFSQPGSPATSTQVPREERTEGSGNISQTEEEAIEKRNENQNVLDIRDQVEIL